MIPALLGGMPSVEKVKEFERLLRQLPEVDLGTRMIVHGRVAVRAIFIPAGCALTGVQTKLDNVSIVLGDITVTTDEGPKRITGFALVPAKAGFKRAGFAHADTWWVTTHHTDKTDLSEVEAEMVVNPSELQTSRIGYQEIKVLEVTP